MRKSLVFCRKALWPISLFSFCMIMSIMPTEYDSREWTVVLTITLFSSMANLPLSLWAWRRFRRTYKEVYGVLAHDPSLILLLPIFVAVAVGLLGLIPGLTFYVQLIAAFSSFSTSVLVVFILGYTTFLKILHRRNSPRLPVHSYSWNGKTSQAINPVNGKHLTVLHME